MRILAALIAFLHLSAAVAATITVNDSSDDAIPGDGQCTLREALRNVDAAGDTTAGDCAAGSGTGDHISFNLSLPARIVLTSVGELVITRDVVIEAPTAGAVSIDGNKSTRVFAITSGHVSLKNLIIENGFAILDEANAGDERGGRGCGIFNQGNLKLSHCLVRGNGGTDGSGIYNSGTATLRKCVITDNGGTYTDGAGGGVYNDANGTMTISACLLDQNRAADQGGAVANRGMLRIIGCTITGNTAHAGGGLWDDGVMRVAATTIANNWAGDCGGVYGADYMNHCVIVGNSTDGDGGGVCSVARLERCTVAGNSAQEGGGIYGPGTLSETIVASNRALSSGNNCSGGRFTDGGGNLISDDSCEGRPIPATIRKAEQGAPLDAQKNARQ